MPRIRTTGRVTIRLFLDEQGKLNRIQVIKTEDDAQIEKMVLNAAKGTSFPVPPVVLAQEDPACERLMTVPGIGRIISSATVAATNFMKMRRAPVDLVLRICAARCENGLSRCRN
jgi:hypothetical protein